VKLKYTGNIDGLYINGLGKLFKDTVVEVSEDVAENLLKRDYFEIVEEVAETEFVTEEEFESVKKRKNR